MISRHSRIYISGHRGMLGKETYDLFKANGYTNIITATSSDLNLTNQADVNSFFEKEQPEYVIHIAAKVGGINANIQNPATFLYDNLMIQNNVIDAAYRNGVKKFVFIGSSCIYPRECEQPMKEEYLLDGKPEPTNEGYAIAKIAGVKLLEGYRKQYGFNNISLIPSNLYGPNDSFDLAHAHVLSSLVKKFVDAKENNAPTVSMWGTGIARREFLHVGDFAKAILFMFENHNNIDLINVGPGTDISIKELAELIAAKVDYTGELLWDASKPNGMLRKCMDVSRVNALGFKAETDLSTGIDQVIDNYKRIRISI